MRRQLGAVGGKKRIGILDKAQVPLKADRFASMRVAAGDHIALNPAIGPPMHAAVIIDPGTPVDAAFYFRLGLGQNLCRRTNGHQQTKRADKRANRVSNQAEALLVNRSPHTDTHPQDCRRSARKASGIITFAQAKRHGYGRIAKRSATVEKIVSVSETIFSGFASGCLRITGAVRPENWTMSP
jgi:hypothetical protein